LATAVVDAYLGDQQELKSSAARRDTEWMAEQMETLRAELIRSEKEVEDVRQKYGLTETDRAPNSTTGRQFITDLNAQLSQAKAEVAARQARYEQVQRMSASSGSLETLPEVTASKTIIELRLALSEASRKLESASRNFTPAYTAMARSDEDVRHLRAQIAAEVARIVDGIRTDYETAVARQKAAATQLAFAVGQQERPESAEGRVQLRQVQRVAEANRAFYEARLKQLREVEQQQSRMDAEARVISPPATPERPSFPRPILFVLAGAFLGCVTGVGAAALGRYKETRLAEPESIEEALALHILAKVPQLVGARHRSSKGNLATIEFLISNPLSPFADSIRSLRTALQVSMGKPISVLLVTSAIPGEGKSTIAASLAFSNALAGRRTVLVDVDVRIASLSHEFGTLTCDRLPCVPTRPGLASVIQPYNDIPLSVVSIGVPGQPRPDMIESVLFRNFIRLLSEEFDLVVLDTSPVLLVPDAIALSKCADTTILVAAVSSTPTHLVQEAAKLLRARNSPLAGVVLNKMEAKHMGRYYLKAAQAYYGHSAACGTGGAS
ncbi:MAG: P-loop NTPase, partial [Pseudomonadota bacterium]|nr:P-loop NTPase [Pseudomonadota bacterium]